MSTLRDLHLFENVVELKSFSAVANKYGTTHSSVSKRITRLEESLGSRLFNRNTRNLSLTEAGMVFYEHCVGINSQFAKAKESVAKVASGPNGTLRINAPISFSRVYLVPILNKLLTEFSGLQIDLQSNESNIDPIQGAFDLTIRVGELKDSGYHARRLVRTRRVLCASPQYLRENGDIQSFSELSHHRCLIYKDSKTTINNWLYQDQQILKSVKVAGNFCSSNCDMLCEAALLGRGVAYLPSFLVRKHLDNGCLVELLQEHCEKNVGIYAIYPNPKFLPVKVRTLINKLVEYFEEIPVV